MRTTQIILGLTILWTVATAMVSFWHYSAIPAPEYVEGLMYLMWGVCAVGSYVTGKCINDHDWLARTWYYWNHPSIFRPASILKNDLSMIIRQGNNNEIQKIYHEIFERCEKQFYEDNFPTLACFMVEHLTRTLIEEAMQRGIYTGEVCDSIEAVMVHQIAESSGEVHLKLVERDTIARKRLDKQIAELGYT
jgi:hypothetical protein